MLDLPVACVPGENFLASPPAGVPFGNADSRALRGKVLRIDVDSTNTPAGADLCGADPALRTYGIPPGNPYAGDAGGNTAACDEIYHYGLRNPWRFSFDRQTHDLILGDVGQGNWEEINLVSGASSALNFGWKLCDGFHQTGSASILCTLPGHTAPIHAHRAGSAPDQGYSITGGYRYRGPDAHLRGIIFSGDANGNLYALERSCAGTWHTERRDAGVGNISGFGEGQDGHLYLTTSTGMVLRLMGSSPVKTSLFCDGFESP